MPEIKILGDSPTTEDGLGFDSYVAILLEAINNFDARSPLTIGIHGRWGSGKTSLMRMLEKRFKGDKNVTTTWFNAWAHGREEQIGLALLQQVLIEFQKDEQTKKKFAKFAKSFSKLLADAALRKTTGIRFREAKELFKNSIEVKGTLRADFENAIMESKVKRLVVFIDDLDRCLPEKTIEILEVIKLFLDVPRCVFVIGVAKEVIAQGIAAIYKYKTGEQEIPVSGKDYIEKIIQIPFTLPPIREKVMIEFIGKLGISKEEKEYAEIVAKGTECNPRTVKTFLNTLRIRQQIVDKSGGELEPAVAAKLLVIERTFPELWGDVKEHVEQNLLCMLERLAKGEADEDLIKKKEGSQILKKHCNNEFLMNTLNYKLKDKPSFCGIDDIRPYIYLSGMEEMFKEKMFKRPYFYYLHSNIQKKQAESLIFLMNKYIKHFNIDPKLILDVGCGTGTLTKDIWREHFPRAKIVGIDSSESMIRKAKEDLAEDFNIEYIPSSIENFEYPRKFDIVYSNSTMHWVKDPDQEKAYRNIHTLMEQNSILAVHQGHEGCYKELREVAVKILRDLGYWKKHENFSYPLVYHTKDSIKSLLEKIGFELVQVQISETGESETLVDDFVEAGLLPYRQKLNNMNEDEIFVEKFKQEAKKLTIVDTTRLYFVARKK